MAEGSPNILPESGCAGDDNSTAEVNRRSAGNRFRWGRFILLVALLIALMSFVCPRRAIIAWTNLRIAGDHGAFDATYLQPFWGVDIGKGYDPRIISGPQVQEFVFNSFSKSIFLKGRMLKFDMQSGEVIAPVNRAAPETDSGDVWVELNPVAYPKAPWGDVYLVGTVKNGKPTFAWDLWLALCVLPSSILAFLLSRRRPIQLLGGSRPRAS